MHCRLYGGEHRLRWALEADRRESAEEREIVALARAAGLDAERTWHTAQSPDARDYCCDVRIDGQSFQVERRRDGFGELHGGLANVAGLFVRSDGREWLAVLPADEYMRLLEHDNTKRLPVSS